MKEITYHDVLHAEVIIESAMDVISSINKETISRIDIDTRNYYILRLMLLSELFVIETQDREIDS